MDAMLLEPPAIFPWIEFFKFLGQALLAIIAVGVTAVFAHKQAITAARKLQLDLFDRRIELYTEISEAMSIAGTPGKGEPIEALEVYLLTTDWVPRARWIFGIEVSEFLRAEVIPAVREAKESIVRYQRSMSQAGSNFDARLLAEKSRTEEMEPKVRRLTDLKSKLPQFLDAYMKVDF